MEIVRGRLRNRSERGEAHELAAFHADANRRRLSPDELGDAIERDGAVVEHVHRDLNEGAARAGVDAEALCLYAVETAAHLTHAVRDTLGELEVARRQVD